ncbi:MAG: T9SS type A sorting domain-containing protein [Bacteroidota bacterium]
MFLKIVSFLFLISCTNCYASADNSNLYSKNYNNNYYVAKDGDDANAGTEESPFLTINKAASVMQAGDICYIKGGVYRERLTTPNGGQEGAPITFTNYENDEVLLSATEIIDNWEPHVGNIYRAKVNMPLGRRNALYYNGDLTDLARWPNNADHDPFTVEAVSVTGGSASDLSIAESSGVDLTGSKVWYLGAHSGMSWARSVTGTTENKVNFTAIDINKWPFNPHNPSLVRNGNRGRCYFFDKLSLLDYAKEWYYNAGSQIAYFQIPDNTNVEDATIEYAAREQCIFLTKDYIVIDGINTFGGKVHLTGQHCTVKNGVFQHGLQQWDALDNTTAQEGNGAIHIQSSFNIIEGNFIEYGSHNGIWIQGWNNVQGNIIRNNTIRYFNTVGTHSSPIRCAAVDTKIIGNTISHTGRDGIYAPRQNCEIAYNDVSRCMLINNDGGIFYVVGNDEDKNSSIHHNWFHDTYGPEYADGRSAGIYLDNRSKGYSVHHNVVWNIDWSAVQMNWDANDNEIFNNTFWEVDKAMGIWLNGYVQENNKVWNNYASIGDWEGQDVQSNTINRTNTFEDIDEHDFRPKAGSFLIDKGRIIEGITDGFVGTAPDLGAYEFGGEFWVAGAPNSDLFTSTQDLSSFQTPTMRLMPNPARSQLMIQWELPNTSALDLTIASVDSKVVYQNRWSRMLAGTQQVFVNTSELVQGIYVVLLRTENGVISKKLVVQ